MLSTILFGLLSSLSPAVRLSNSKSSVVIGLEQMTLDRFILLIKQNVDLLTLELLMNWMNSLYLSEDFISSYTAFINDPYSWQIIHQDGRCELLNISWKEGQRSYIHNHDGQLAVIKMHSGKILSRRWKVVDTESGKELGEFMGEEMLSAGAVNGVAVDEAHELICLEDAVSIHCYTRPLSMVVTFDSITGQGRLEPAKLKLR
ncbi:MAG TPA: cysteine dioxygenase family protein [Nostocaceae cyanobacterium]|nr:cysteine dioxygenase family protein [Nostocaceae cyanobacterium]